MSDSFLANPAFFVTFVVDMRLSESDSFGYKNQLETRIK